MLLWALGHIDDLGPPAAACDVGEDSKLIAEAKRANALASGAAPRSASELLDAADLYYHLHWSAIELRLAGKSNALLNESVIRERHRALNWLIRHLDQDWDDVSTDT